MLFFYNFLWILAKKSYILERVSFEQHEEFQIILSWCVQFSEHVSKIYYLSNNPYKIQLHNPFTNFDLIEKNVDAQKAFFCKKYVFLCGTRTDISFVNLNKLPWSKFFSKKFTIEYAKAIHHKLTETYQYQ